MRFAIALAAAFAILAPAGAAEPPKPAVVAQAKPMSRLLADYREMIRQAAGPVEGDRAVKRFETELKDSLGDEGFEGLDLDRPLAAYAALGDTLEDARLVLVVPAAGEKEFLAFLDRLGLKTEAVQDQKALYDLSFPEVGAFPKGARIRFADGWAYVGLNGGVTDAKELVPVAQLFDNADQSLFSAKLFPGRVPEKLLKELLDQLDQTANGIKGFLGAGGASEYDVKVATALLEHGPKLIRRYSETGLKEAAEVGVKFGWDAATGDTVTEFTIVPKPGTELAKFVAAKPATANRFANLVPKDAAVGALFRTPLDPVELQTITALQLEALRDELKTGDLPEAFRPVVDEAAKGLIRAVKKGELDYGVALVGPAKDGKFTVVAGMSFDDPAAVEKALRVAAKPAALLKLFEFDVAKVGEVGVHKVPLARAFPEDGAEELGKVFGKDAPGYVAFAKDAVFVAYGPDALSAIEAALAAKPGPAPVVDVTGNASRLAKLIAAAEEDEKFAAEFAKQMEADDKPASFLRVTVEGGKELKAKATLNLRRLPRAILVSKSELQSKPVNPPGR